MPRWSFELFKSLKNSFLARGEIGENQSLIRQDASQFLAIGLITNWWEMSFRKILISRKSKNQDKWVIAIMYDCILTHSWYLLIFVTSLSRENFLCCPVEFLLHDYSRGSRRFKNIIFHRKKTVWKITLWSRFHWFQLSREFHISAPLNRFKAILPGIRDPRMLMSRWSI